MKSTICFCISVAFAMGFPAMAASAASPNPGCMTLSDGRKVCQEPDSLCVKDNKGSVFCSTPGGGIEFDRYRVPVCGPGYCVKDRHGEIFCSSKPRGAADVDQYGNAICSVSCVPADQKACVKLN